MTGLSPPRVLRFDTDSAVRVVVGACGANIKNFKTGLRPMENRQTALTGGENHTTAPLARGKCTPSAAFGGVSPGGGDSSGAMP